MISLLLVIFPIVVFGDQARGVPTVVPWSYGNGWEKITYVGPSTNANDLAWRAARVDGAINQNLANPMMPLQVTRAQQKGLHIQLEAVYVEANCVGINTPGAQSLPTTFDFIVNTKCYQRPMGKRYIYRVSEDISPEAPSHEIVAWKKNLTDVLNVSIPELERFLRGSLHSGTAACV
ncbi:hypothetical protein PRIPAC_88238 [Pristionchus pacificus]|uniref:Uncharacterized protein n=1 Tax=Pristionchus pacificus TaxID=54126 RepID=A0A2A6B9P5_PRIPA|nr:hypothetical protein PRIPAC_88238 [Pristionchus pacificus]|eukprot:PDM62599.1 hypothetical protein PRIPAC_52041 [Pristionchus pacificus]